MCVAAQGVCVCAPEGTMAVGAVSFHPCLTPTPSPPTSQGTMPPYLAKCLKLGDTNLDH